jgi:hypothetical protein
MAVLYKFYKTDLQNPTNLLSDAHLRLRKEFNQKSEQYLARLCLEAVSIRRNYYLDITEDECINAVVELLGSAKIFFPPEVVEKVAAKIIKS